MSDAVPGEVARLVAERAAARAARDFARADALRDRIRDLGWEVADTAAGSSVRPRLPESGPSATASLLDEPSTLDASLVAIADDYPDDLARFVAGLAAHPPSVSFELVIVANGPTFDVDALLADRAPGLRAAVVGSPARLGWADAANLGLRRTRGEIAVLVDTSIEPSGEFVAPLLAAFADPRVGLAGPWGVTSANLREFEEAPSGEVDAIEGYCLAVRRAVLREVGLFDGRFRFYRHADLDLSFAARAAGWHALRTSPLPLERHEHRGWSGLDETERARLSRRNYYRFLKRWGERPDLLVHPGPWPPPRRTRP